MRLFYQRSLVPLNLYPRSFFSSRIVLGYGAIVLNVESKGIQYLSYTACPKLAYFFV